MFWHCSPRCDSCHATIFFSLRDDEPSGRPTPWARIIDRSWQIWTSSYFFTDKQTSSWWTSFEVIFFAWSACLWTSRFTIHICCAIRCSFFISAHSSTSQQPTQHYNYNLFATVRSHRDGLCLTCGLRAQIAWTQASRPANYFFC